MAKFHDEITAAEFKTHCLKLMDTVAKDRTEIVVTKRGKPVAKLVPYDDEVSPKIFGFMAGTVTVSGDILSPIDEVWNAQVD
jgi:prevent-host-death family protein